MYGTHFSAKLTFRRCREHTSRTRPHTSALELLCDGMAVFFVFLRFPNLVFHNDPFTGRALLGRLQPTALPSERRVGRRLAGGLPARVSVSFTMRNRHFVLLLIVGAAVLWANVLKPATQMLQSATNEQARVTAPPPPPISTVAAAVDSPPAAIASAGCLVSKWGSVWRIDDAGMRAWIRFPTSGCKLRALDFSSVEALPRSPKITMDHFAKVGEGGRRWRRVPVAADRF